MTPKQSSRAVVSSKEVFMNAAAAIPETRSARIHQWVSDSYPHFRKWYHLTLSFQNFCMISKNIHSLNIRRLANTPCHSRCAMHLRPTPRTVIPGCYPVWTFKIKDFGCILGLALTTTTTNTKRKIKEKKQTKNNYTFGGQKWTGINLVTTTKCTPCGGFFLLSSPSSSFTSANFFVRLKNQSVLDSHK